MLQDVLSGNEENWKIGLQDEVICRLTQISVLVNQKSLCLEMDL